MKASPSTDTLIISPESPRTSDALVLLRAAVLELITRYGGEDDGDESFDVTDVERAGGVFLVARIGEAAVGCAALRPYEPGTGEIKRMFVSASARNRGVGKALLQEIEEWARNSGYEQVILETGTEQPEAIALYQRQGYTSIPNFGVYADDLRSRCFAKRLPRKPRRRKFVNLLDSPLSRLRTALEQIAETATVHTNELQNNAAATRAALVEPTLRALGWDIANLYMVMIAPSLPGSLFTYQLRDENGVTRVVVGTMQAGFALSPDTSVEFPPVAPAALFVTNGTQWQQFVRTASGEAMPGPVIDLSSKEQSLAQTATYLVRQLDAAHFWTNVDSGIATMRKQVPLPFPAVPPSVPVPTPATVSIANSSPGAEPRVTSPVSTIPVQTPSAEPGLVKVETKQEKPSRPTPAPSQQVSTHTPLSTLVQAPVTNKTPRSLLLPDGTTTAVYRWSALLGACCQFALSRRADLPVPLLDAGGNGKYLIVSAPPPPFDHVAVTHNGLTVYVRTDYNADECLQNAVYVLQQVPVFAGVVEPGVRLS